MIGEWRCSTRQATLSSNYVVGLHPLVLSKDLHTVLSNAAHSSAE